MTTPLLAMVLTLKVAEPVTTPAFLGRAVYRFLLDHIAAQDDGLAQQFHDRPGYKPFTCSTVMGGQRDGRNARRYMPDRSIWLRLTGLSAAACAHLDRLAADPPEQIMLARASFQVQDVIVDGQAHRWAGRTTYAQLAAPHLLGGQAPAYQIGLRFASPTTFRTRAKGDAKRRSWPAPLPQWVFESLLRRWNQFSDVAITNEVSRFTAAHVAMSRYDLATHAIPLHRRGPEIGCTGEAHYTLLQRDRYWAGLLNLLAAYSFYAGIGYQTTVGMGQTHVISD
jgi:CRISPR-associated endoribonuclease Cas6